MGHEMSPRREERPGRQGSWGGADSDSAPGSDLRIASVHQQLYSRHERAVVGREG